MTGSGDVHVYEAFLLNQHPARDMCERAGLQLTSAGNMSDFPSARTPLYEGPFYFPRAAG